jgi:hypothetical protein
MDNLTGSVFQISPEQGKLSVTSGGIGQNKVKTKLIMKIINIVKTIQLCWQGIINGFHIDSSYGYNLIIIVECSHNEFMPLLLW